MTSTKSPLAGPFLTSTHSAEPFFTRTTNIRSLVLTTLELGTSKMGCFARMGHLTSGSLPGSQATVRIDDIQFHWHRASFRIDGPGDSSENATLAPLTIPPTSAS